MAIGVVSHDTVLSIERCGDSFSRTEASIMGESALVDKETGRVFWEGGASTTLVESLFTSRLNQYGVEHAQAAVLTTFITLALIGIVVGWLRKVLVHSNGEASGFSRLPYSLLVWMILKFPRVENKWLVAATIALYLLESYNCSTRRFLTNSMTSPEEVDQFVSRLRSQQPVVTWSVRSFHFEKRKIFALPELLKSLYRKYRPSSPFYPAPVTKTNCASMVPFTRKVVTSSAKRNYQYQGCTDSTIAGIWTRPDSVSATVAPFTKIILTKLLVLSDRATRLDYFRQQADFVTEYGRGDEYTEFCTDIQVEGYKPTILVVRPIEGVPSAKLFNLHLFWLFTLMGLTFPYRVWFKRHCDSLRVTLVKETSSRPVSSASQQYWGKILWLPSWSAMQPSGWERFKLHGHRSGEGDTDIQRTTSLAMSEANSQLAEISREDTYTEHSREDTYSSSDASS